MDDEECAAIEATEEEPRSHSLVLPFSDDGSDGEAKEERSVEMTPTVEKRSPVPPAHEQLPRQAEAMEARVWLPLLLWWFWERLAPTELRDAAARALRSAKAAATQAQPTEAAERNSSASSLPSSSSSNTSSSSSTTSLSSTCPSAPNAPPSVARPVANHKNKADQSPPLALINLAVLTLVAQVSQVFVVARDTYDAVSTCLALLAFAALFLLGYAVWKALARKPQQHHARTHPPPGAPGSSNSKKKKKPRRLQHHHKGHHHHHTHPHHHRPGDVGTVEVSGVAAATLPALLEDRPVSPPAPVLLQSPSQPFQPSPPGHPTDADANSISAASADTEDAASPLKPGRSDHSRSPPSGTSFRGRTWTEDTVTASAEDEDDWSCGSASGRSTPTCMAVEVPSSPRTLSPRPRHHQTQTPAQSAAPVPPAGTASKEAVGHAAVSTPAKAPTLANTQSQSQAQSQRNTRQRRKNKVDVAGKSPLPTQQLPGATPRRRAGVPAPPATTPARAAGPHHPRAAGPHHPAPPSPSRRALLAATSKRQARAAAAKAGNLSATASQRSPRGPTSQKEEAAAAAAATLTTTSQAQQRQSRSGPVVAQGRRSHVPRDGRSKSSPCEESPLESSPTVARETSNVPTYRADLPASAAASSPTIPVAAASSDRTLTDDRAAAVDEPGASPSTPYGTPLQVALEPPHASFFSSTWSAPVPGKSRSSWSAAPNSDAGSSIAELNSWTLGEPAKLSSSPFSPSTCSVATLRPPPGLQVPQMLPAVSPFTSVLPGLGTASLSPPPPTAAAAAIPPPGFVPADPFGIPPKARRNPFAPSSCSSEDDDGSDAMEADLRSLIGSILDS